MSNGIDFVIGGRNNAQPAMDAVERSLAKLSAQANSLRLSTMSLARSTLQLATAWGVFQGAVKVTQYISAQISEMEGGKEATERLTTSLTTLGQKLAELLAPLQVIAFQGVAMLADAFSSILGPAIEWSAKKFAEWKDNIGAAMMAGVTAIVKGITLAEVVIGNLSNIWQMMVDSTELQLHRLAGIVAHVLTEVIPKYAVWFSENFYNLINDGINAAVAVVSNAVTNLIDTFQVLWDFIASGGTTDVLGQLGEIAGRSYLEGFQATVGELPSIAERVITDRERELIEKIGKTATSIGEEYSRKFADRMKAIGEFVPGVGAAPEAQAAAGVMTGGPKKSSGGLPSLQASESRLLTRGSGSRQIELMERTIRVLTLVSHSSKQTAAAAEQTASTLRDIKDNTSESVVMVPTQ